MPSPTDGTPRISAEDLKQRMDRGDRLVLLDVREDHERTFAAIAAPSNVTDLHVPMGLIPARLSELRNAAQSSPLVVYCHLGVRSLMAAEWLRGQGLDPVSDLEGGIDAWSRRIDASTPRY